MIFNNARNTLCVILLGNQIAGNNHCVVPRNKKIFKLLFLFMLIVLSINLAELNVYAEEENQQEIINNIYQEQVEISGAKQIKENLPKETQESLEVIGVKDVEWQQIMEITPGKIFEQVLCIAKEKTPGPIRASISVLAIMLICALMESFKLSLTQKNLNSIAGVVGTLCVCIAAIEPIIQCISKASVVIKGAAGFMIFYIPVMTGIMVASGQAVSAASYNMLMMGAGEVVSQVASNLLVPLLNIFLAISIVASISPSLNLSGICNMFSCVVKWILTLSMTIFVSLLTLQSIVGSSVDSTSSKAFKFVISSFVPVVGGVIGDAFGTVQSCIKLLKSGVGAFGIMAAAFIFVPIIIECIVWLFTLNICAAVGDIFKSHKISLLLRNAGKVVSTMLSIIVCCMMILLVSTVIILVISGGAT